MNVAGWRPGRDRREVVLGLAAEVDHRQCGKLVPPDYRHDPVAGEQRHVHIHEDEVGALLLDDRGDERAGCGKDLVPRGLEVAGHRAERRFVVVDVENFSSCVGHDPS